VNDPVDLWAVRLPDRDGDRRARARQDLLSEVVRSYGLPTAELDRTCRFCGDPRHGKPRLVGSPDVDLSIAHAGSLLVVAAGRGRTVGVDVETIDRLRVDLRPARGIFTASESAALVDADDWRLLTLTLWTRKEAVLKAIGRGLAHPLDQVPVTDPATSVLDGEVFDVEVEGSALGVATFMVGNGEVLSVAAARPWPGVRWRDAAERTPSFPVLLDS
jgi:4'-phosphopantetheinyl transferase